MQLLGLHLRAPEFYFMLQSYMCAPCMSGLESPLLNIQFILDIQFIATQYSVYVVMLQYHEISMYSLCVVLASQLPTVLIIMYNPAKPTQYLDILFVWIST